MNPPEGFVPVADLEIDHVLPTEDGFDLQGRGADAAEYLVRMHLDMPIDRRTRTVLGEILAQSEWRVWRRLDRPARASTQDRVRERKPPG